MRGEWDVPQWSAYETTPLARPIESAPAVTESVQRILCCYMASPGFVTVDRYCRAVKLIEGEIGYWAIFSEGKIYPVARIIVEEQPTSPEPQGVDRDV